MQRCRIIFVGGLFFFANVAGAHAQESNFWADRQSLARSRGQQFAALPQPVHFTPKFSASSRKPIPSLTSKAGPTVLHIQDVHLNAEAQASISASIRNAIETGNVGLVAVEGAFGPIDLSPFRRFPDQESIRKVADHLLKKNEISGPLHAAFTASALPRLVGVDDAEHHQANVHAYKQAAPLKESLRLELAENEKNLFQKKQAIFSPRLMEFDRKVRAYQRGQIGLGEYAKELSAVTDPRGDAMLSFLRALALEQSLGFSRVETERTALLTELTNKLAPADSAGLLEESAAYRAGETGPADFYRDLRALCVRRGLDLARYPAMDAYIRYAVLADGIDAEQLFRSLRAMEIAAYAALAQNEEEKTLLEESRYAYLTGKLIDFALTQDEWQEFRRGAVFAPNTTRTFEEFYRQAEIRDEKIAENLLKEIRSYKSQTRNSKQAAVLVTGGFHSAGIDKKLTAAGFNVVRVVPKITKVEGLDGTSYLNVFAQQKTPLEKMFAGQTLFLSPVVWTPAKRAHFAVLTVLRQIWLSLGNFTKARTVAMLRELTGVSLNPANITFRDGEVSLRFGATVVAAAFDAQGNFVDSHQTEGNRPWRTALKEFRRTYAASFNSAAALAFLRDHPASSLEDRIQQIVSLQWIQLVTLMATPLGIVGGMVTNLFAHTLQIRLFPEAPLTLGARTHRPATPLEAVAQWQQFAESTKPPDSPLIAPVQVSFFVTTEGNNGWQNHITKNDGLYGKALPPLRLADGRSIVPMIGDVYETAGIEDQSSSVEVRLRKFTPADYEKRLGLKRIFLEDQSPATATAWTFPDMVGRLAFFFGPGGFVESVSNEELLKAVDSTGDFLQSVITGDPLRLTRGRLEVKSLGTIRPKLYKFLDGKREVTLEKDAKINLVMEEDGATKPITVEELLQRPGMILGSRYQPGFPSPSGTEVARFSEEGIPAEGRFSGLGGEPTYHTFSRFLFGDDYPVAGSLRFTRHPAGSALRLAEALHEHKLDPSKSALGKWKTEGSLEKHLRDFYAGLGKNHAALLLSGKVLVLLGAGRFLHGPLGEKRPSMAETYKFFLYNTDITNGRLADLGDYFDIKESFSDYAPLADTKSSVAVLLAMAGQFFMELEKAGVPLSPEVRQDLLRGYARGFAQAGVDVPPELHQVRLDDIVFVPVEIAGYGRIQINYNLKIGSEALERTVNALLENITPLMKQWHVGNAYDAWAGGNMMTSPTRFNPYDPRSKQETTEEETGAALDKLARERPRGYESLVVEHRYPEKRLAAESDRMAHPVVEVLNRAKNRVEASSEDLAKVLSDEWSGLPKRIAEEQAPLLKLMTALHEAFKIQSRFIQLDGQPIELDKAFEQLNQMRQALEKGRPSSEATLPALLKELEGDKPQSFDIGNAFDGRGFHMESPNRFLFVEQVKHYVRSVREERHATLDGAVTAYEATVPMDSPQVKMAHVRTEEEWEDFKALAGRWNSSRGVDLIGIGGEKFKAHLAALVAASQSGRIAAVFESDLRRDPDSGLFQYDDVLAQSQVKRLKGVQTLQQSNYADGHIVVLSRQPAPFEAADERLAALIQVLTNLGDGWARSNLDTVLKAARLAAKNA